MSKKHQIWLTGQDRELVIDALNLYKAQLAEYTLSSPAFKMAGRYTARRIDDVLLIIIGESKQQNQIKADNQGRG